MFTDQFVSDLEDLMFSHQLNVLYFLVWEISESLNGTPEQTGHEFQYKGLNKL